MIIHNALVFEENAGFFPRDLYISGEFITASGDGKVLEAGYCYAIPGLVDIHQHGCVRHDYSTSDVQGLVEMAEYQACNGITAVCATTMTLPEEVLARACRRIGRCHPSLGAELVGINLEGPFLSPDRLGAQNPAYLHLPDADEFRRLQEAAEGQVRLLAVAPEVEGAMDLIADVSSEVTCSLAHTAADYDTAMQAFAAGARQITHMFNAMPPLSHRAPGVIGAAFDTPGCRAELIADGVHVHPSVIRASFALFGDNRIVLISDSMMATGLNDGLYELGGQEVEVTGNTARLVRDGAIAGSVTNLMECLRFAVSRAHIPLHSAVKCATVNPAKAIGVFDTRGSLEPGKYADIVLLDEDLNIRQVILRGRILTA